MKKIIPLKKWCKYVTGLWSKLKRENRSAGNIEYLVKDVNESFNTILIHGMNMLLYPFSKDQIQLQKTSLFAPIQQSVK